MSEWAKKQACWEILSKRKLAYSESFEEILIEPDLAEEEERASESDVNLTAGLNTELEVFNLGADFWKETLEWGTAHRLLSPSQAGVLQTCAAIPTRIPTPEQSKVAMEALRKLREEGFKSVIESA